GEGPPSGCCSRGCTDARSGGACMIRSWPMARWKAAFLAAFLLLSRQGRLCAQEPAQLQDLLARVEALERHLQQANGAPPTAPTPPSTPAELLQQLRGRIEALERQVRRDAPAGVPPEDRLDRATVQELARDQLQAEAEKQAADKKTKDQEKSAEGK